MATRLALEQGDMSKPSTLLHSIFMSTVNTAATTLISVASNTASGEREKWKAADHLRYLVMLMIWFTVWVLRVLMDHFPCSVVPSPPAIFDGLVSGVVSSSLPLSMLSSSSSSLVLQEGFKSGLDGHSAKAIGRAMSHVFALVNETPATSRKYQFAVAMADRIVDENARDGHDTLRDINRTALSQAFARTASLLQSSLQGMHPHQQRSEDLATWPFRILHVLPLGPHIASYLRGICCFFLGNLFASPADTRRLKKQLAEEGEEECVAAEKLAQELLWITKMIKIYSAVDEAIVQWSSATALATASLSANPRVQGAIVKITAILFRELAGSDLEAPRQIKFRMFMLWLPLFCYAGNGLTYPILTGSEKAELEKVMEDMVSSLPATDQEVILANWLQDFTISSSDWPNLQRCYDQWCRSSRNFLL